jgi:YD repeat-containing protein
MSNLPDFKRFRVLAIVVLSMIALLGVSNIGTAFAANGSVAYTYDALGRVTTVSYDTGVCIIYAYDANGNRTSETVSVGSANTAVWGTGVWGCFNWTPH